MQASGAGHVLHATFSRHHHGLAEDLRAEDEGRPDVGPDRRAGGVTGVMSHVDLGPELSLLVLDTVGRGLKWAGIGNIFASQC